MTAKEAAQLIDHESISAKQIEGKLNTLIMTENIELTIEWLKEFVGCIEVNQSEVVQIVASAIMTYQFKTFGAPNAIL